MFGHIFIRTFIDILPRSDASLAAHRNDSTAFTDSLHHSISGTRPCNHKIPCGIYIVAECFVNTFLIPTPK